MPAGRPVTVIVLNIDKLTLSLGLGELPQLASHPVPRAKLLWAAQGESNTEIAHRVHCTKATVDKWRQRLAVLYDELRSGRFAASKATGAALLKRTRSRKPTGALVGQSSN